MSPGSKTILPWRRWLAWTPFLRVRAIGRLTGPPSGPPGWLILGVLAAVQLILVPDAAMVNVALPSIQRALRSQAQCPDCGTAGRRAGMGFRPPLSAVLLPTPQAHDAVKGKTAYQIAAMRKRGHGVANLNELAEKDL